MSVKVTRVKHRAEKLTKANRRALIIKNYPVELWPIKMQEAYRVTRKQ